MQQSRLGQQDHLGALLVLISFLLVFISLLSMYGLNEAGLAFALLNITDGYIAQIIKSYNLRTLGEALKYDPNADTILHLKKKDGENT